MRKKERFDIRGFSFEQFIDFLFDHESSKPDVENGKPTKWNPWFFSARVEFDPQVVCVYYTDLFRDSFFLADRFSKAQLDEGFWAIQATGLDCSAYRTVWDKKLDFGLRQDCVRSMAALFESLFFNDGLDTAVYMWWDSFCYDFHCGNKKRSNGGEEMAMQDVLFETLLTILWFNSDVCRAAALHGLSHLHHPGTEEVIRRYLDEAPFLNNDVRVMAQAAAQFKLQ